MNLYNVLKENTSAQFFALVTIVSLLLSAFPVAFFVANAASNLYTDASVTVASSTPYASSVIDASGHESLSLSFDYDAETLDNGDVLSYGWSDGSTYTELNTISGANEIGTTTASDEIGSITISLPLGAQISTLEIQMSVAANSESDSVDVTNIMVLGDLVPVVKTTETIKVYGDNLSLTTGTGWLFNRDLSNATPIEFNTAENVIGSGALYVLPLSNTVGAKKFIGEYFWGGAITDLDGFSYDFKIGAGGAASDENQFYLNVYANFGESAATKYYDCKYDVVPTVGSTGSFTTITFDPTQSYTVTTRGGASASPYACPAVPADMDALSSGSVIRAFAINAGDTSLTDADLDGYFDNVVLDTKTKITTFDFDPDVVKPNLSITTPLNNGVIGTAATAAGIASDDGTGLASVTYTVTQISALGGSFVANIASGATTGLENWTFDVSGLSAGFYRFKVTATDNSGNTRTKYNDVEVDVTKPSASITYPSQGQTLDNVDFTVTGTASDSQSGISKVLYTVTNITSLGGTYVSLIASSTAVGTDNWSFDVASLDNGFYRIKIQAFDGVGNWKYEYHDIVVDGAKPEVTITYPANAAVLDDGTFTVTGTSSDTQTPIAEVKYTVNKISAIGGTYVASVDAGVAIGTEDWSFDVVGLDDGFYRLKVQAFDENGNWRYRYHDVEVKELVASLMITAPGTEGELVAGTYAFTAEYIDDDNTVDKMQWAVRFNTCAASTGTVAGNVDGYNDSSTFIDTTFTAILDTTGWMNGNYCFVVNPKEGPGEDDLRATRNFEVDNLEFANYCGDGVINQEWEMCEVGEEGCTDYCTQDNQCTDLQLVKITLDEEAPESVSFDGNIYLGSVDGVIPNGTWFNFNELGDKKFNKIAKNIDGLAVQRDTTNGLLTLAFVGGNARNYFDFVQGTIETKGITLGSVDRSINPQYKLENGSGKSFDDVFDVNGTEVMFDLRATTGNDAVSIEILEGDLYNCPYVPTYTLEGAKYQVVGEAATPYEGWIIYATNGSETLSTTTDSNGEYSFEVGEGEWEVYEATSTNWTQERVEQNGEVVTSESELASCNFSIGSSEAPSFAPTLQLLEVGYNCDFYNSYSEPVVEEPVIAVASRSSSSGGTRSLRTATPAPLVLGASTSFCPYVTEFMQIGESNNSMEVMKLQLFLNIFKSVYGGVENPITGTFGVTTDANVKAFQEHFRSEVLDPWFEKGIVPHNRPTGFVYKTTLWKINSLICDDAEYPSFEGEDLTSNVANDIQDRIND